MVFVNRYNASPVCFPVLKNDKNVINKNDANTNGSETLSQVGQMHDKYSCPTKNRFALLVPFC